MKIHTAVWVAVLWQVIAAGIIVAVENVIDKLDEQWHQTMLDGALGLGCRHESWYMVPPYANLVHEKQQILPTGSCDLDNDCDPFTNTSCAWCEKIEGEDDSRCPNMTSPSIAHPKDNSDCPWYYIETYDPKRYPIVMTEARCKSHCGLCGKMGKTEAICEKFYNNILVLYQTGEVVEDEPVYKLKLHPIAVGCTCARPREHTL